MGRNRDSGVSGAIKVLKMPSVLEDGAGLELDNNVVDGVNFVDGVFEGTNVAVDKLSWLSLGEGEGNRINESDW